MAYYNDQKQNRKVETVEDLEIWQKCNSLVIEIFKILKSYPMHERAGLSQKTKFIALEIPILIEKGFNKKHFREKMSLYIHAKELLDEVRYLLTVGEALSYSGKIKAVYPKIDETTTMFMGLIRAMEKRQQSNNNPNQNQQRRPDQRPHQQQQQ